MKKNIKWVILIILVTIFLIIAYSLNIGEIHKFDNLIYSNISKIITPSLTNIVKIITEIGGPIVIILTTILLMIFIKNKNYKKYILINLLIIFIGNQLLKNMFNRERPNINKLVEENGYSFPSGHSMVSTAFYGFLIYLIYKHVKNKKQRNILIFLLSMLVVLIGLSRIYLGVHYASDVIGGIVISIAYLIVFISIINKKLD